MALTFYDTVLNSSAPHKAVSLNTWRTRFVLNYKRVPYTTVWLPYAQISETIKSLGVKPTMVLPNGLERYTVPTIEDGGKVLTDSFSIAEYLDKTYPGPAPLFPPGTRALQAHLAQLLDGPSGPVFALAPLILPRITQYMDAPDAAYFDELWSGLFGCPLDQLYDTPEKRDAVWTALEAALNSLDKIYQGAPEGAVFLGGEKPLYVDFMVGAMFITVKYVVPEDGWDRVSTLNGGRWAKLLDTLAPYMSVN